MNMPTLKGKNTPVLSSILDEDKCLVRIETFNGDRFYYNGPPGQERMVRAVHPGGPINFFEGERNHEICVRVDKFMYGIPWIYFFPDGKHNPERAWSRPRRTPSYLWGLMRNQIKARRVVWHWRAYAAMSSCAPGGAGRKRDRDAFERDFVK